MFTGLIEGQGLLEQIVPETAGVRLTISVPEALSAEDSAHPATVLGDSVAINGCCLTVVAMSGNRWEFQAGEETLSRTNIGRLQVRDTVNLERALAANARLGGHFVQGHVDGVGTVQQIQREGEWIVMRFQVPPELAQLMVSKGSVTVDGISLTLVDVTTDSFSVALIPHTLEVTTLGKRQVGDWVNLETDILGKYIHKMVAHWQTNLVPPAHS